MQIKSVEYEAYLEFTEPIQSIQYGHIEYFNVKVVGSNYYGNKQVYLYDGPNGLLNLFDEMSMHWSGWKNELKWGSLENEFSITATCDQLGHITLAIILQENTGGDYWVVNCRIIIEAGQLDRIAHGVRSFFMIKS